MLCIIVLKAPMFTFFTLKVNNILLCPYSLSEVPDYQVPLAMRTDVIDQILAIAMHPAYDCNTAAVSVAMIQCLTQSPEAHVYIARKEAVENMLQMCELRQKMVSDEQSLAQEAEKEHAVMINTLKYVAISVWFSPPLTCSPPLSSPTPSLSTYMYVVQKKAN